MTFAAPLFLLALVAGLIPVVLHLVRQQKTAALPFSTLRFVQLSAQRTRRRKYMQDGLLVSLRASALLLIALALARPTLTPFGSLIGRDEATAVVVILDNSASLATVDKAGRRWTAARQVAHSILDQLREPDWVALLLPCGPSADEVGVLSRNHEVVRQAVGQCQVRYQRADLVQQIRNAEAMLAATDAVNQVIYVVTDMQSVSWKSSENSLLRRAEEAPPIVIVRVDGDPLPNVAIVDVTQQSTAPLVGLPIQLTVKLQGDPKLARNVHAECVVDGRTRVTSPTITIAPGSTIEHSFTLTLDQPGIHRGHVELVGEDACGFDNRRFFAVCLASRIPVAVVQSSSHEIPYLEDAYFLHRALTPQLEEDWPIRTTALTADRLASEPLTKYAVIFCVNLPALDAESERKLADYVRGGGNLVWACGDQVDAAQYNAMNRAVDGDLLPAPLGEPPPRAVKDAEPSRIGWIDADYPAFAPLVRPPSLYQSVIVKRHLQIELSEERKARVLAKLDGGEAILVSRSVAAGSVLLLGTSVRTDWSNLPTRPVFLPLIAGLTFHLAGAQSAGPGIVAGRPLQIPARFHRQGAVELTQPNGEVLRIETPQSSQRSIRLADTHDVGIYVARAIRGDQQLAAAVNLDAEEIDPAIVSVQTLGDLLLGRRVLFLDDPAELADAVTPLREGTSLMVWCLILLLLVLLGEVYVANRST